MKPYYHEDPSILHVGCEEPHAYLIPYQAKEIAAKDKREESAFFESLCGVWDFHWFPSYEEAELTPKLWDTITVPMSWQMVLDKGYDTPHYTESNFPFPVNPPYVPKENPCGLYRKNVWVEKDTLESKRTYLVFEGVDSCFYLYVNQQFVGYSQVSHNTSEFDLTPFLQAGENELCVLVLKWCDGSYLEDQDKIRLSGIFREVYLLHREPIHITDVYLHPNLNESMTEGTLFAELSLSGEERISYCLSDPSGVSVASGQIACRETGEISLSVTDPLLWNDEEPNLYFLALQCGNEYFCLPVGFRRFELKGRRLLVNGKAVKGRGINRHDSHPELGAAVSEEHMLRDLYILKANNINMIRTAHYPNDPRFLGLCDRLGFYVCDEADIESHGMDQAEGYGRNSLSDDPVWTEAYLDRARRMMEEDKNHPCVLLWSTGNESGIGQNLEKVADLFHERMPGCLVHSERYNYIAYLLSMKDPSVEGFERYLETPYIDIDSRMYATPEICLERYLKDTERERPFFLCEFCHAMGNGPGDLSRYWDLIWSHEEFFGGCVWEFCDHAVNAGTVEEPRYLYGGDFGEKPHDGNFCADGLVYPDRRLHGGMLEYRQVLRPCVLSDFCEETGVIMLKNRNYFTDLSDLDLCWRVECNGKVIREGRIEGLAIPPEEERGYRLALDGLRLDSPYCYLTLFFRTNCQKPWAEKGHEVGVEQIRLTQNAERACVRATSSDALTLNEDKDFITVGEGNAEYRIGKRSGELVSLTCGGEPLLASAIRPNLWRAPTDNDRIIRKEWERLGFDRIRSDCRACRVVSQSDREITVEATLVLGADGMSSFADMCVRYTVEAGRGMTVSSAVELRGAPEVSLPRLGVIFSCPCGFEFLRYFGLGPMESYSDKRLAAMMGEYATTVSDHFEHYIKPQENMAHDGTVWAELRREDGVGLWLLSTAKTPYYSFNCSHFTPKQLTETEHDFELISLDETVVCLDLGQCGIGSNSCGPALAEEYTLKERSYSYSFRLLPVLQDQRDPFEALDRK